MIHVARAAKPNILVKKEAKWKAAIRAASRPAARERAQSRYRHRQIKDALITMFHGKCAYCESAITHIDYGHIEHFRPKALPAYYELAVDWDNLLLACGRCNGAENKGTEFPGPDAGGPLVNPTEEEPSAFFRFDFDVAAKLANVLDTSERGATTWRTLGLNRPDLLRRRSNYVRKLWFIGLRYHKDQEAKEIIDLAVEGSAEYSAFAREVRRFALSRRIKGP